jgi:hypothetical protein
MSMRVTTYAYPWDLATIGVESALREMADVGIEGIDLAASYHPIDALAPRGPAARYFTSARGGVFFPARLERYGRIVPSLGASEVCAVWPQVADRAAAVGIDLNAWVVTLFQPWIVDAHPDCARVLAAGDRSGSGACPANDDVREYCATLCADVVDQFGVGVVRLEGILPQMWDLDWLRPRVLVDVSPLARELLALCFCPSCERRGTAAGLDVARVRSRVNDRIVAELARGPASSDAGRSGDLVDDAELQAYAASFVRAATELARQVRDGLATGGATLISSSASTPFRALLGDAEGALLVELIDEIDQVVVLAGSGPHAQRTSELAAQASTPKELAMLVARLRVPGSGAPTSTSAAGAGAVSRELQDAIDLQAAEMGLYNYGLLRESDVREFLDAVHAAFPDA